MSQPVYSYLIDQMAFRKYRNEMSYSIFFPQFAGKFPPRTLNFINKKLDKSMYNYKIAIWQCYILKGAKYNK